MTIRPLCNEIQIGIGLATNCLIKRSTPKERKKKSLHKSLFCIKYPFIDSVILERCVFGSIEWKIDGKYELNFLQLIFS